jgi:DNA-directed RNA polymerase subunit RPC12/RpoP
VAGAAALRGAAARADHRRAPRGTMPVMPEHRLKTAPMDEVQNTGVTVMIGPPDGPLVVGEGAHDYLCGFCGTVIAQSIDEDQIQAMWVRCRSCSRAVEFP